MNKNMTLKRVLSGLVIGGILASMGGMALADSTDNSDAGSTTGNRPAIREGMHSRNDGQRGFGISSESVLDELVTQGLITQSEADQLLALQSEKAEERKAEMEELKNMTAEERKALREENKEVVKPEKRQDLFSEAVEKGILTQAKVDVIREEMQEQQKEKMEEQQQEKMNSLVEQGLINQDQANQLLALQDEKAEERKAKMEELKNMTAEERKAFREENKEAVKAEKGQGLYSEAVEAGILTQDEVNTIQQKMQESRKAEMQEKQDEIFAALINQGTITQAQADTIQAYLEEETENRKAEFEKIKDLSREERKEYLEENKESKKGLLSKLMEEGTITQEQADEIAKLLHKGRP